MYYSRRGLWGCSWWWSVKPLRVALWIHGMERNGHYDESMGPFREWAQLLCSTGLHPAQGHLWLQYTGRYTILSQFLIADSPSKYVVRLQGDERANRCHQKILEPVRRRVLFLRTSWWKLFTETECCLEYDKRIDPYFYFTSHHDESAALE